MVEKERQLLAEFYCRTFYFTLIIVVYLKENAVQNDRRGEMYCFKGWNNRKERLNGCVLLKASSENLDGKK